MTNPRFGRSLALAVMLIILGATMFPVTTNVTVEHGFCLFCGSRGVADAILNVILFAPLGATLIWSGLTARRAIFAGVGLSIFIELVQFLVPGRDSSFGDLLFNSLGVVLAIVAVRSWRRWLLPRGRSATALSASATVLALGVIGVTAYALQVSLPRSVYYGQWTPVLGHLYPYEGRVLEAYLGPMEIIPTGRLEDSDSVRTLVLADAPWKVTAVAGPNVPALASLVTIYDEQQRQITLIGPDRDDLVFRTRRRTARLLLDAPDLRLLGAFADVSPGDTLDIAVWHETTGTCLALGDHRSCGLGYSAGDGWALLLYPESLPAALKVALAGLWIALLFLPAIFWARGSRSTVAAAVVLLVGLPLVSVLGGLQWPGPVEYAGALAGMAVGFGLGRLVRRFFGGPSKAGSPRGLPTPADAAVTARP